MNRYTDCNTSVLVLYGSISTCVLTQICSEWALCSSEPSFFLISDFWSLVISLSEFFFLSFYSTSTVMLRKFAGTAVTRNTHTRIKRTCAQYYWSSHSLWSWLVDITVCDWCWWRQQCVCFFSWFFGCILPLIESKLSTWRASEMSLNNNTCKAGYYSMYKWILDVICEAKIEESEKGRQPPGVKP